MQNGVDIYVFLHVEYKRSSREVIFCFATCWERFVRHQCHYHYCCYEMSPHAYSWKFLGVYNWATDTITTFSLLFTSNRCDVGKSGWRASNAVSVSSFSCPSNDRRIMSPPCSEPTTCIYFCSHWLQWNMHAVNSNRPTQFCILIGHVGQHV